MPSLPDLDLQKSGDGCELMDSSSGQSPSAEDEMRSAACGLVCEWAQKVLSRQFDAVEDLARFLLNSHYIGTKSMAALTVMTGTPTGLKTPTPTSAFVPTSEASSFQPQVKTLASPSADAKQQLQRKIQKKQQEQKLHSPLPGDAQNQGPNLARRAEASTPGPTNAIPCGSPALISPQPTIGIVVAAVPSPITVQRSRQLMTSPSPVGSAEGKVLPTVNFQVVTHSQSMTHRQSPKTPQNISASPVGDRLARHRYPQILPKPSATGAITLRSPPTLLITNSPIKTHHAMQSQVNVVKVTAISLAPGSTVSTSTNSTVLRPALTSAGVGHAANTFATISSQEEAQSHGSLSVATMAVRPAAPSGDGKPATGLEKHGAVQQSSGVAKGPERAAKYRAASEPSLLVNCSPGPDRVTVRTKSDPSATASFPGVTATVSTAVPAAKQDVENVSAATCHQESTLYLTVAPSANQNAGLVSGLPSPSVGVSSVTLLSPKDSFLSGAKSPRKRTGPGLESSNVVPVKRVFISQQPLGVTFDAKPGTSAVVKKVPARPGTPARPESAPCRVTVKQHLVPTQILALSDSPVTTAELSSLSSQNAAGAKTQTSLLLVVKRENMASLSPNVDLVSSSGAAAAPGSSASVSEQQQQQQHQALLQQVAAAGVSVEDPGAMLTAITGPQQHTEAPHIMDEAKSTMWVDTGRLEELQKQAFDQAIPGDHTTQQQAMGATADQQPLPDIMTTDRSAQLSGLHQEMVEFASSASQHGSAMDYFSFNDDEMTQDSIVEELVQMEEQMKLKGLQPLFSSCVDNLSLQGQSGGPQGALLNTHNQGGSANFYHSTHSSTTPVQTPTPTPTPTPTEMTLGGHGLTRESPCSHHSMAPITPVEGALGGRHTPVSALSNCSSSVPPSPVECRNPFAFTPINSSMASGYHDASVVSVSFGPVKPMQRPTATHPDKSKLEWINSRYNSGGGAGGVGGGPGTGLSISNHSLGGLLPSYQELVDDHFRKPHAFAIPGHGGQSFQAQSRQQDAGHFGCLTPISPVQQQTTGASTTPTSTTNKQDESFAVPAPLDNKGGASSSGGGTFRCRSVSPAVRQRTFSGTGTTLGTGTTPGTAAATRLVVSPFSSPMTSQEILSILCNSQSVGGTLQSMAQRSQSVPLNVMMQSVVEMELLPVEMHGGQHQSNAAKITNVLLSKMDSDVDDAVRGLGVNNLPSNYTARMNLTQILETQTQVSPGGFARGGGGSVGDDAQAHQIQLQTVRSSTAGSSFEVQQHGVYLTSAEGGAGEMSFSKDNQAQSGSTGEDVDLELQQIQELQDSGQLRTQAQLLQSPHAQLQSPHPQLQAQSGLQLLRPQSQPQLILRPQSQPQLLLQSAATQRRQQEEEDEAQQQLDFNNTVKDLLGDDGLNVDAEGLNPSSQLIGQVASELNDAVKASVGDYTDDDMRLTSDLSRSITDLNTLDANLLFDPSGQQQEQYEDATLEELKNDPLFQQICSDTVNSSFDWLESKDQPTTVEMLG
ncbi:hypothetical protein DPEC_G00160090 [Dallia pectoralis]|uniref:Uncharacterized protein n=1 Tax=Dallia pectoralis TaxID=75939 RepID=A0ACC2GG30_DALPE|nr:hypothetical protein DPEC_G00160090 [Dallia pectoralis]